MCIWLSVKPFFGPSSIVKLFFLFPGLQRKRLIFFITNCQNLQSNSCAHNFHIHSLWYMLLNWMHAVLAVILKFMLLKNAKGMGCHSIFPFHFVCQLMHWCDRALMYLTSTVIWTLIHCCPLLLEHWNTTDCASFPNSNALRLTLQAKIIRMLLEVLTMLHLRFWWSIMAARWMYGVLV